MFSRHTLRDILHVHFITGLIPSRCWATFVRELDHPSRLVLICDIRWHRAGYSGWRFVDVRVPRVSTLYERAVVEKLDVRFILHTSRAKSAQFFFFLQKFVTQRDIDLKLDPTWNKYWIRLNSLPPRIVILNTSVCVLSYGAKKRRWYRSKMFFLK